MEENRNRFIELQKRRLEMKELYINKGLPLDIYEQSQQDIIYRLNRFKEMFGYDGITARDMEWLEDVLEAKFFDLGVLRFQIFVMDHKLIERTGYDYIKLSDEDKLRFKEGNVYINVHIAKDTSLDPKLVDESFAIARNFFTRYFSELKLDYFICRTWLIDESLRSILAKNSNIIMFGKRFEPIARGLNSRLPFLRIYETDDMNEIIKQNHITNLQKKAYLHKDTLGVTFGCIPFNR